MFFTVLYQSQSVNKKKKSINYPPKLDFLVRKLTAKTAKTIKHGLLVLFLVYTSFSFYRSVVVN